MLCAQATFQFPVASACPSRRALFPDYSQSRVESLPIFRFSCVSTALPVSVQCDYKLFDNPMRSHVQSVGLIEYLKSLWLWRTVLILFLFTVAPVFATQFKEAFTTNPVDRDWRVEGESALFAWQESTQTLMTTWDSSQPNSFYYLPLPRALTEQEDFSFAFDLVLEQVNVGTSIGKPSTFEIAFGFFRQSHAFSAGYIRGTGRHTPNLVEWNYFPEADPITPTVTVAITSPRQQFLTDGFVNQLELVTGVTYHVDARFRAGTRTLTMEMTANGEPFGRIARVVLPEVFAGFTLDAFGITSYSDDGQFSSYAGSIYARGQLDNLELNFEPTRPRLRASVDTQGLTQLKFFAEPGETYVIESSLDLEQWNEVTTLTTNRFQDLIWSPPFGSAPLRFYRLVIKTS